MVCADLPHLPRISFSAPPPPIRLFLVQPLGAGWWWSQSNSPSLHPNFSEKRILNPSWMPNQFWPRRIPWLPLLDSCLPAPVKLLCLTQPPGLPFSQHILYPKSWFEFPCWPYPFEFLQGLLEVGNPGEGALSESPCLCWAGPGKRGFCVLGISCGPFSGPSAVYIPLEALIPAQDRLKLSEKPTLAVGCRIQPPPAEVLVPHRVTYSSVVTAFSSSLVLWKWT